VDIHRSFVMHLKYLLWNVLINFVLIWVDIAE
jgi:hypothetical protein